MKKNRMNPSLRRPHSALAATITLGLLLTTHWGWCASFSEWRQQQEVQIATTGLIRLRVSVETLDAARPNLEDLRIIDLNGNEIPYALDRPQPQGRRSVAPRTFNVTLLNNRTTLLLESAVTEPLEGLTLITPDRGFIKAALVEGSNDQRTWQSWIAGAPIFQQYRGASQMHIPLPGVSARWIRITLEDRLSPPVPFTGASLHASQPGAPATELLPVQILEQTEGAGESRLTLDLGGAHLNLATLEINATDSLYLRPGSIAVPQLEENVVRERILAQGTIYRIAVDGQPIANQNSIPIEADIPTRTILLTLRNDDSPPLRIPSVQARVRPAYLVFFANATGKYRLLTGHPSISAPRYDVSQLATRLRTLPQSTVSISPIQPNPNYREPAILPEVPEVGTALDVSGWRARKPVQIRSSGVQSLDLDVEVLATSYPALADVRLISRGKQIPYLIQHTSQTRPLNPSVTVAPDSKRPRISRWSIQLTNAGMPLTQLLVEAGTALFTREMRLYEERGDSRDGISARELGRTTWTRTAPANSRQFSLRFDTPPTTSRIFLETDNGDNPPLEFVNLRVFYPVTRVLFKATADTPIDLYYDNPQATVPRYDLGLIAGQVLAANKNAAILGVRQGGAGNLSGSLWKNVSGGVIFWVVLAIVVIVLLFVFSRLLATPPTAPPGS